MPSFPNLRYRHLTSDPSSAGSLATLNETASKPPERLHRVEFPTEDAVVFYIFRIPGRQELCLSTARPGGDVITDIDVSASLYMLRLDEDAASSKLTLLRLDPAIGGMREAAVIQDPPGRIDVFESGYGNIERAYWNTKCASSKMVNSSYGCNISSFRSHLSFTTPWVGTADIVASKIVNALKCYHNMPHIEGDQSLLKLQISELRFNFSVPRMSSSGNVTSKRSSIAIQIRNSSALENLNAKRRSRSGSASEDASPALGSRNLDNTFQHPSFYVPASGASPEPNTYQFETQPTPSAQGSDFGGLSKLEEVPEDVSPRESVVFADADHKSSASETLDTKTFFAGIANHDQVDSPGPPINEHAHRVQGPRPIPVPGPSNATAEENIETKTVPSHRPVQMVSSMDLLPQSAEPSIPSTQEASLERQLSNPLRIVTDTNNVGWTKESSSAVSQNHKSASIRRKPVRSGTNDTNDSPSTPMSGKENSRSMMHSSTTVPGQGNTAHHSPIKRRPVANVDYSEETPNDAVDGHPKPITEHSASQNLDGSNESSQQETDQAPPPLPPREPSVRGPPLPPRHQVPLAPQHIQALENAKLDLSLGREKLGGGLDGEQAKLGKLIIEPEGLKMLDLIVAANLLAFRRAFVAAEATRAR